MWKNPKAKTFLIDISIAGLILSGVSLIITVSRWWSDNNLIYKALFSFIPLAPAVCLVSYLLIRYKTAEFMISSIYIVSVLPFILSEHHVLFYGGAGFLFGVLSVIFKLKQNPYKAKTYFDILCGLIIIITVLIVVFNHHQKIIYTNFDLMQATFLGGILGMIATAFIIEIILRKR